MVNRSDFPETIFVTLVYILLLPFFLISLIGGFFINLIVGGGEKAITSSDKSLTNAFGDRYLRAKSKTVVTAQNIGLTIIVVVVLVGGVLVMLVLSDWGFAVSRYGN